MHISIMNPLRIFLVAALVLVVFGVDKADAEKQGFNAGPPGGSQANDGGGKKED